MKVNKITKEIEKLEKTREIEVTKLEKIQKNIEGYNEQIKQLNSCKKKYEKVDEELAQILKKE